jgi:hypothetical protein
MEYVIILDYPKWYVSQVCENTPNMWTYLFYTAVNAIYHQMLKIGAYSIFFHGYQFGASKIMYTPIMWAYLFYTPVNAIYHHMLKIGAYSNFFHGYQFGVSKIMYTCPKQQKLPGL